MKPHRGWAIYFPNSDCIDIDTIRRTRSASIAAFLYGAKAYVWWRRIHGVRPIRVQIVAQDDTP